MKLSNILQFIAILSIYYDNDIILHLIDKAFFIIILLGYFLFETNYCNIFAIILLFITLLTRFLYERCLFPISFIYLS